MQKTKSAPRIVITAHGESTKKDLEKVHKSITLWRTKKGQGGKPVSMLTWAIEAQKALTNKG